jgi:CRISPR system Cascade subunit CasB
MFETDTGKERIIMDAVPGIIRRWFRSLQERNSVDAAFKGNGRAWRAELRHAQQPYGALTTVAFHHLSSALPGLEKQASDRLALAIFASVAAHAHHDNPQGSFARQLGEENKGAVYLSRQRFDRLLAVRTPAELASQLVRAVKLRGDQGVNIVSLADGIFLWMREWQAKEEHQAAESNPFKRHAVRWASEYLLAAEKTSRIK